MKTYVPVLEGYSKDGPVLGKIDIEKLSKMMEEMANAPKEEIGKRQPGERGMFEIQRREAARMPLESPRKVTDALKSGKGSQTADNDKCL